MSRCCVYEAFETDRLLYIGISKHWPNRWVSHSGDKSWWQSVTLLRVTWYDSRDEAQRREGELIRLMRPPHNIVIPDPPRMRRTRTQEYTTYCNRCPTQYSSTLRPEGSRCHDLSLPIKHVDLTKMLHMTEADGDELACHGICQRDNPWCECNAQEIPLARPKRA